MSDTTRTSDPTSTNAASTSPGDDLRPQLFAAQEWCADLVARVDDSTLHQATPCAEFDVRRLLGHIGTVYEKITGFGRDHADPHAGVVKTHEDYEALCERIAAERVDAVSASERAEYLLRQVVDAREAWTDDTLGADISLGWGPAPPGRVVAAIYLMEVLAHGWDLATATGLSTEAPAEIAEAGLAAAHATLPAEPRGMANGVPFRPVVEPVPDAGATERLANWVGRESRSVAQS